MGIRSKDELLIILSFNYYFIIHHDPFIFDIKVICLGLTDG